MKNKLYSWIDFILGVGQIGSVIMVVYKFVLLIEYTARDTSYNFKELATPIALWAFIAGVASLIREKIDDDDFDDESYDYEE